MCVSSLNKSFPPPAPEEHKILQRSSDRWRWCRCRPANLPPAAKLPDSLFYGFNNDGTKIQHGFMVPCQTTWVWAQIRFEKQVPSKMPSKSKCDGCCCPHYLHAADLWKTWDHVGPFTAKNKRFHFARPSFRVHDKSLNSETTTSSFNLRLFGFIGVFWDEFLVLNTWSSEESRKLVWDSGHGKLLNVFCERYDSTILDIDKNFRLFIVHWQSFRRFNLPLLLI